MKKYQIALQSFVLLLTVSLTTLFTIQSCSLDTLTEGIDTYIDTDFVHQVASIQVIDANPDIAEIAGEVEVEILGADASRLYTLAGENTITAIDGLINLAVKKSDQVTESNPLKFSVLTKSNGYINGMKTFVLQDDSLVIERISMVNIASPPSGVSVETTTFMAGANGTTAPVSFGTSLTAGKQEKADVTIPTGTKLFDANGNALTGEIAVTLAHFDEREEASLEAFPGGFDAEDVVDQDGNTLEPGVFFTAGFAAINMSAGGTTVKTFSQPIDVTMSINDQMINPETGNVIAIGDTIPVWSLDGGSAQWRQEKEGIVVDNNGTLEIQFPTDHLSYFNLDWKGSRCYRSTLTISSGNLSNKQYYTQLIDIQTNRVLRARYLRPRNGEIITFYNAPINRLMKLKVYEGGWYCRTLIAESASFNICNGGTIDLSSLAAQAPETTVRAWGYLKGYCGTKRLQVYTTIYYKEVGGSCNSPYWRFLGRVYSNGYFYTSKLQLNKTYDFKVRVGSTVVDISNITIADQLNITLTNGTAVNIAVPPGNNYFTFFLDNIPIPDAICDLL